MHASDMQKKESENEQTDIQYERWKITRRKKKNYEKNRSAFL